MKNLLGKLSFGAIVCTLVATIEATTINYQVTYDETLGTGTYQYTVFNDSLAVPLEDFIIYFPTVDVSAGSPEYINITPTAAPDGWSLLAFEPTFGDLNGMAEGFLVSGSGILPGSSLGGFAVDFDYLGDDLPGSQEFEIYDADFNLIDSGFTTSAASVPEVLSTARCLGFASFLLALTRLKRRNQKS